MAARKEATTKPQHGFNDVIGLLLIAASVLLLGALFSFDVGDVVDRIPPNPHVHNICGKAGAWIAKLLFFVFGAGAFIVPPLMLAFGVGHWFEFLSYLRRRWMWAVVMFLSW